MTLHPLDTRKHLETPEGVELTLRVAGPSVRAMAFLLDFLIRFGIFFACSMVLGTLGDSGTGIFLVVLFLLEWLYPVLFEVLRNGATPGKQRYGLQVVHDDGTPIDWSASLLRNLLRTADFFPFFYGFGLICMLLRDDFKRLGDLAAGTLVVYRESSHATTAVPLAEPIPAPAGLTLVEQRAVIEMAQRQVEWHPDRTEELCDHLAPMTGYRGKEGVTYLVGIANSLVGRRKAVNTSESGRASRGES